MFENPPWGARMMVWDPPMLALCALGTAWAWPTIGAMSLVAPLVFGHFLLFCNVFRVRRSLELIWAGAFLLNAAVTIASFDLDAVPYMAAAQLPVTLLVIGYELRHWRYHGVLADRLNPELVRYLEWSKSR